MTPRSFRSLGDINGLDLSATVILCRVTGNLYRLSKAYDQVTRNVQCIYIYIYICVSGQICNEMNNI